MNTAVKPAMKATECSSTRERVPASTSPASRSTDMPVMKDRYDGNSGSTQGERNENSPAENATSTPSDSVIARSPRLPEDRLEEGAARRPRPVADAVGEERAVALAVDDERRGDRPDAVEIRHRHLGIEAHREGQVVLLEERGDHRGALGVLGDGQHDQPLVAVLPVEAFHV